MCHDGTATKWAICHAADEDEAIEGLLARLRDALEDDVDVKVGAFRRTEISKRDTDKLEPSPKCTKCMAYQAQSYPSEVLTRNTRFAL